MTTIYSAVIALLFIFGLPAMMGFSQEQLYLTNSIYSFLAATGLWILVKKGWVYIDWHCRRLWCRCIFFAFLFSECMAVGAALDGREYITFGDTGRLISVIFSTISLTIIMMEAVGWFTVQKSVVVENAKQSDSYTLRYAAAVFAALLICWLPVLLAVYPGFFVYDGQDELIEVLTRSFTTHHPLLHVLFLGGTIAAVHKLTDSYNLGILCYTVMQMCVVAFCFTYMLSFLKRHGVHKKYRVICFLFLAFFPVIPMYALCSTKDTLFTAALLMYMLLLYEMLSSEGVFFQNKKRIIMLIASTFLMLSLRNNAVYAYILLVPVILWVKRKNGTKFQKWLIVMCVLPLLIYWLCSMLLIKALGADNSAKQEILTVPIMQLTRTYVTDETSFSEEEKELLYSYLPKEALDKYTAKLSDAVKVSFQNDTYRKNPAGFWKLWLNKGKSHMGTYLNAWLYTSYGFWYPDTVIDVYSGITRYTYTYEDSSYFGFETEEPGVRESRLPLLEEFYRKLSLEITQQKIPAVSMLFSPAFLFWCYAFAGIVFASGKDNNKLLAELMALFLWLTVLFGPTYMVRYVLIFWFALPLLVCMLFAGQTGFKEKGL